MCADRLIGIRHPLFARGHVPRYKMLLLMGAILGVPALLTAHQHMSYDCLVRSFCNGTQLFSRCLPVTQESVTGGKVPGKWSKSLENLRKMV